MDTKEQIKQEVVNSGRLFENVTSEIRFAINFRMMLMKQTPEFLRQLDSFIEDCYYNRQ